MPAFRTRVGLAAVLLAAGCGRGSSGPGLPDHGEPPQLSGPLLAFDSAAAASANAAQLPAGFTGPQDSACGTDPTAGFLSELSGDGGLDAAKVPYEWAPVVPGPDANHPTVGEPEFLAAGTVRAFERSGLDLRPTHPFGYDTTWDLTVDAPFLGLVHNRPGDDSGTDTIHCEIESGLYPDATFGLAPEPQTRVLLRGAWILDCGHPPYEAELHPPSFVAVARANGGVTESIAFANPYRVTQLFGPKSLATAFSNANRFHADGIAPFVAALKAEVIDSAVNSADHLEMHVMLEPTVLPPTTWFVCAPGAPPSPDATLEYGYQFVSRTGVTVSLARRGKSGCLELHAEAGPDYRPWQPPPDDQAWPWSQIDTDASSQLGSQIDVRQMISDALTSQGFTAPPALLPDHAPVIEAFAPLAPRPLATGVLPASQVTGADDQPFPFYGRVQVQWK